ncbi:hypothetical protein MIND_01228500 [Mycena indigotica]|uniref:Aminoglycoside phosphotransferase domain-containing protein n=1 Tax=Mycena indigotica TaxID=2126181 RepID=A0A8H6S413_9AGAR|nr:uncharacterized protein MIND_01228500 [Mycena indigotica]KAF7292027.1 hypothetical protein MIND_01228500 [Mycena indigotica]
MPLAEIALTSNDQPADLPNPDTIIAVCRTHFNANKDSPTYQRGMPLMNPAGTAYAWVKFGRSVTMAEARTQDYVASTVNGTAAASAAGVHVPKVYLAFVSTHGWGYIVMELVTGVVCRAADGPAVAKAVELLITVRSPTLQPGPVHGGPIFHSFFNDWESAVAYPSVELLQKHINAMLRWYHKPERVDFAPEVATHGLRLCLSDMNRHNFMKKDDGTICALDFGGTCFLPVSFFDLALYHHDPFTWRLSRLIRREPPAHLYALQLARGALVITGNNKLCLPAELR